MALAIRRYDPADDRADTVPPADTIMLDMDRRQALTRHGLVYLSPVQCALVNFFGRHRGVLVTNEQILECVRTARSDPSLPDVLGSVHIARLRKKLASVGAELWLQGVWGRGYLSQYHVRLVQLISPPADPGQTKQSDVGTTDAVLPETKNYGSTGAEVTKRFAEATRQAIQLAHARGLAVPVRRDGAAIELRPDGTTAPIDDLEHWHPTDWKSNTAS